ncbi:MAG: adenylate/guanylate cyclase domain-containing protein [Bradyrhizobium sp.]|jgi:TolB-like protein/class 3 adenylate cyclase
MSDPMAVSRRLVAVFAADVEGYSRMMGADEVGTFKGLTERRAILDRIIGEHRGRIANTAGDSVLAEFGSAVDAMQCAVEAQTALAEANSSLAPDRRISFRMGIHIGDVMVRAGDLFGDGVNIAARLQTLAKPGTVCISGATYDQVRKVLPMTFVDLGVQQVKNIQEPIRAYQVGSPNEAREAVPARVADEGPPPLPDKPSIAVLPFQNMSGDPEQEYFADGMVEEITSALSRFKWLFVIARNSSFTFKGRAVDIKQVGRELGVRYVLEGSVRKAGARLRITGQLIDVATGAHLWADRFDGALEDIFDLQDKLTQQVVGAIIPELDRAEMERASRRLTGNINAVTAFYRGLPHIYYPTTSANNDAALENFKIAIALDPNFAAAYGGVASCLSWRRANKWPGDNAKDNAEQWHLANRIKELGTDDAFTLCAVGFNLFWFELDFDAGIELVEHAIQSNPNFAPAYNVRGLFRVWDGGSDAAIADFERAMRLSPRDPYNFNAMSGIGLAHHNAGRHAEAAMWTDKAVRAFPPAFFVGLPVAIVCYVGAGRLEDAKKMMGECLRRRPDWRRSTQVAPGWVRSPELRAKFREACIEAGLPE